MSNEQRLFFKRMAKVYKKLDKNKQREVERTIIKGNLRRVSEKEGLYLGNQHNRKYQSVFNGVFEDANPVGACDWFKSNQHIEYDTFVLFAILIKEFALKNRFEEKYPELFV